MQAWHDSMIHSVEKWISSKEIFRQINSLINGLVKPSLSRNFWQKCVRSNFRHFHTVWFSKNPYYWKYFVKSRITKWFSWTLMKTVISRKLWQKPVTENPIISAKGHVTLSILVKSKKFQWELFFAKLLSTISHLHSLHYHDISPNVNTKWDKRSSVWSFLPSCCIVHLFY